MSISDSKMSISDSKMSISDSKMSISDSKMLISDSNMLITTGKTKRFRKLKRNTEVKQATTAELRRMSLSLLKVPTMNWKGIDLGHEDFNDQEETGTYQVTGVWRYVPSWMEDDNWTADGEWNARPAGYDSYHDYTGGDEGYDEYEGEEYGEEGPPPLHFPRAPLHHKRQKSCDGRIETFTGKTFKKRAERSSKDSGTVIRTKIDLNPFPGFKIPRFIYDTESDGEGRENQEVHVALFNDNSVLDSQFRIWRATAVSGSTRPSLETQEEEDEDIEDILSLEVLEALQPIFSQGSLNYVQYKAVFAKLLNLPQRYLPKCVGDLFTEIDTFGIGLIAWDDFCDFLQQKYAERAETEYSSPPIDVVTPCKPIETVHHSPITRAITLPDRGVLTFSEDGIVSLFTADFKPRIWRALGRPAGLKSQKINDKKANKWYTDIVLLQSIGKYIVPTGEKELQFYDNATYDPYCQIAHLYSVPIHLDAKVTGIGMVIVMGDTEGNVTIFEITETISTLRFWSQHRRIQNIPTIYLHEAVGTGRGVRYIKHKVHSDMVSYIIFLPSMMRFVSSSLDAKRALIMQRIQDFKSANAVMEDLSAGYVEGVTDLNAKPRFSVSIDTVRFPLEDGCRTFDVWEEKRLVAAGGLDRIVWVWNLYCPNQPVAKLRGHNGSIFRVVFETDSDTLFSVCSDKVIRVWTLYTNTCIHVIDDKMSRLRGPTLYCFFPSTEAILIQTSVEAAYLTFKRKGHDDMLEGMTHKDAITAIKYNPQMEYFITCSSEDVFVWDCRTGKQINEFNTIGGDGSMHLDTIASKAETVMEAESQFVMGKPLLRGREQVDTYDVGPVTAATLDSFGRRFFTAHTNGVIKAWNFYNGRNLYNLYKPINNKTICDMEYITINETHRYLVTVGWDRRVVVYIDSQGPEALAYNGLPDAPLIFTDDKWNHEDDIWALSFGLPSLIASGDYSGRLRVWNISSGHVVGALKPNKCHDREAVRDTFITALTFFEVKKPTQRTTYLISAGPFHLLHIWRANTTRELNIGSVGWVRPCGIPLDFVTAMKCCNSNNYLVTADTNGAISVWELEDTLEDIEPTEWFSKDERLNGRNKLVAVERENPLGRKEHGFGKGPVQLRLLRTWKCHVDAFAALEICESYGLIATGGRDCSVRIWDMQGRYLGLLGQENRWHVGDALSYQILLPRDVALDMKRIRGHDIFKQAEPEKLGIEVEAEKRALGFEQKKHHHMSDKEISLMAFRYQSLGSLNLVTKTWFNPDTPVGPHRRVGERPDEATLVSVGGGGATGNTPRQRVIKEHKFQSQEEIRSCNRRKPKPM